MKVLLFFLALTSLVFFANAQNPPTVTTSAATNITCNSATLNGIIDPDGSNTTWHFEYGILSVNQFSTSSQLIPANTGNNNISINITGLTPGSTYMFALTATNSNGITWGDTMYFNAPLTQTPAVIVTCNPTGSISIGTSATLTATPHNGGLMPQFEWFVNSVSVQGPNTLSTYTYAPATLATILCIMTSSLTCAISNPVTGTYSLSITTGINENNNPTSFFIFPNPAADNLTFETPLLSTIELLNIQGQLIKTLATSGNKTNVDVSALPPGMYIVQVKTEKGIAVRKFVKE